jgi:glycosyltransferase involved in cell wall biosynthesis
VIYLSDAGATAHADPGFGREVQWDIPLLEGYDYQVLQPDAPIAAGGPWRLYHHGLRAALASARPDWLLIYGYASRMNWIAAHWARRNFVKLAYTSDSNSLDPERMVPVKKVVIGQFFRYIDAFLATSERNVEYLLRYGADRKRIRRMPFAIDMARFTPASNGVEDCRHDFIWIGKFLPRKRCTDFIHALDLLASQTNRPIRACVVGDGPCREALHAQARELPNHCTVVFTGFVNQGAMPQMLQSASTLVFTSDREPYGLVATEAAASGLALIVAKNIGCVGATVLARPTVNALTYIAGDSQALAVAMGQLLEDPALLHRMQRASLEIAKCHDVAHAAEVIEQVVTGARKA